MNIQQEVTDKFKALYGAEPTYVIRAPGRVNLIGEHTDYNDGFVLPMAINRAVWIALRPRDDKQVVIDVMDFDTRYTFSPEDMHKEATTPLEYIKGVAWALMQQGYGLHGWEGVMHGDVPIGAGLSSSAALEMATSRAFAVVSGFEWHAPEMARLGQRGENQWVGVNCGIMDQMISAAAQADHALLIDCRTLETQLAPLPPDTVVVVLDTSTRRGLVESAYNERRSQCEEAAAYFEVPALRDVDMATFEAQSDGLDDVTRRRARHIISENARTLAARDAMLAGDASTMGRLMVESHISLRDDFEVSSEALNAIVECARGHAGCYGARMTGAGFGGCAVALVRADAADDFAVQVAACYTEAMGHTPQIYICTATDGAQVV